MVVQAISMITRRLLMIGRSRTSSMETIPMSQLILDAREDSKARRLKFSLNHGLLFVHGNRGMASALFEALWGGFCLRLRCHAFHEVFVHGVALCLLVSADQVHLDSSCFESPDAGAANKGIGVNHPDYHLWHAFHWRPRGCVSASVVWSLALMRRKIKEKKSGDC